MKELRYKFVVKRFDASPDTLRELEVELTNESIGIGVRWNVVDSFLFGGYIIVLFERREK